MPVIALAHALVLARLLACIRKRVLGLVGGGQTGGEGEYLIRCWVSRIYRDPWNHVHGIGSGLLQGFSDLLRRLHIPAATRA